MQIEPARQHLGEFDVGECEEIVDWRGLLRGGPRLMDLLSHDLDSLRHGFARGRVRLWWRELHCLLNDPSRSVCGEGHQIHDRFRRPVEATERGPSVRPDRELRPLPVGQRTFVGARPVLNPELVETTLSVYS